MQSVLLRIWTRVAVSISYDNNYYTTGTSKHNTFITLLLSLSLISLLLYQTPYSSITHLTAPSHCTERVSYGFRSWCLKWLKLHILTAQTHLNLFLSPFVSIGSLPLSLSLLVSPLDQVGLRYFKNELEVCKENTLASKLYFLSLLLSTWNFCLYLCGSEKISDQQLATRMKSVRNTALDGIQCLRSTDECKVFLVDQH